MRWLLAHDEVDVEEEGDVKEEVGGPGDDETPHVDSTSHVQRAVDDEQWHSGVPHTHTTQYRHRRQYVLVLLIPSTYTYST